MLKNCIKKSISMLLVICSIVLIFSSCASVEQDTSSTVEVIDMLGDKQVVKRNPKKIACASRTTYDLLIAFGLGAYIDSVYYSLLENEWAEVFDKDAKDRYSLEYNESYETYISRGVDLVFSPEKYITDGLREHGIPAVTVCLYGNPSFSEYVYFFADMVKMLWDDENVAIRVGKWKDEMAKTISTIQTELGKHDFKKRSVYYVRGDKNKGIGYTDSKGSFTEYVYSSILQMDTLSAVFETNSPSAEEIVSKNPDVFVVGGFYQNTLIEELKTKEPYKNLAAVKNGNIYNIPVGLTIFEQLSVFSPAFLMDQANKLYPDYFNFDIKGEISRIAVDYFNTQLTEAEILNMLNGLSRSGGSLEK